MAAAVRAGGAQPAHPSRDHRVGRAADCAAGRLWAGRAVAAELAGAAGEAIKPVFACTQPALVIARAAAVVAALGLPFRLAIYDAGRRPDRLLPGYRRHGTGRQAMGAAALW